MANERASYTGVMSTVAAAAAAAAWLKSAPASAMSQIPKELMDLLLAMAVNLDDIDQQQLPQLLAAIKDLSAGGGALGQGWPPNADYVASVRVTCEIALTNYAVPDFPVPDGMAILVKAWPFNPPGTFLTAGTSTNPGDCHPLIPNEPVTFLLKRTGVLIINSPTAGSIAVVTVEQRSS